MPLEFRGPRAVAVRLNVNGAERAIQIEPRRTLLDALRESLALTGAKKVCDRGDCGACTVIVDGRAVYSCLLLAIACESRRIETIEGLAGDRLHPIQEAFIAEDAYQCGFCTPGQIMSLAALLRNGADVSEQQVRAAVSGNLCRCGAYPKIVAAGLAATRAHATPAPRPRPGRGRTERSRR
jgi:xanthine dehydrogenase YagT iron-sulfur-binding subunit